MPDDRQERQGSYGSYAPDDPDRPQWEKHTKIEAEYVYRRADGAYAFSKLKGRRSDGQKVFLTGRGFAGTGMSDLQLARQECPREFYRHDALTSYLKGAGDEPDLLYRLNELLEAVAARPAERVFITEGEKDADTLWELGLIATTNPNGALSWKPPFNSRFAARDVVVMLDNDDKGHARGKVILNALKRTANSIRLVELPGLAANGDVTDWISSGRSKDDLLAEVDRAEVHDGLERHEGRPLRSLDNARFALSMLGVSVRYDEFANRYLVAGLEGFGPALDDAALTRLRLLLEERWDLVFAKERWGDIVTDYARHNTFHPVRDYLAALHWDGVERLDSWLPSYAGAEDSDYVRAVGAICLIAAVRRVREPGCKFDEMLVLESGQGTGKSTAIGLLAINEDWFADDLPLDADSKVLMERIAGRWLVELAELKGMRRGAVEHVKSMLSRRVDKARLAYGRLTTEQPRQCVFIGTTNDSEYLRDMTGNRRFWPVKVAGFDLAALKRDRDQIWAEAAAREAEGASIRLPQGLWEVAGAQQANREIGDPFYELLSERLDGHEGKVRASDVWDVVGLGDVGRRSQDDNVRLSAVMQKLGWRRPKSKLRFDGRPQHAWVKGDAGQLADAYQEVPRAALFCSDRPI